MKKLWIGLIILVLISPLGLFLPEKFGAGSAWGEWGGDEIEQLLGYVPAGMSKLADLWKAPIPDYAFKGQEDASLPALSFSYIISAVLGVAVTAGLAIFIGRTIARREKNEDS